MVQFGGQTWPDGQMLGMHTCRQVGVLGSCGTTIVGGGGGGGGGGRTMTWESAGVASNTIDTTMAMRAIIVVLPIAGRLRWP